MGQVFIRQVKPSGHLDSVFVKRLIDVGQLETELDPLLAYSLVRELDLQRLIVGGDHFKLRRELESIFD